MARVMSLLYLLDTDICIYIINRRPETVWRRLEQFTVGQVGISSITGAELWFGVSKSGSRRNVDALQKFLAPLDVMPFDADAMRVYGELRADLETRGQPIGALDQLISAHAKALGATLVTNNTREFARVRGLQVENWVV